RDPTHENSMLLERLAPYNDRLFAAPAVRPDWPDWERAVGELRERGARAIRAYPSQWGIEGDGAPMRRLAGACAEARLPLVLTLRFEDSRQRHWMDAAPDLPA